MKQVGRIDEEALDFVIESLKQELSGIPDLISLTFVGSSAPVNRMGFQPAFTLDIDTVIILNQLTPTSLSQAQDAVKRAALSRPRPHVFVIPAFHHGPFRETTDNQSTLFIHAIVDSLETLELTCPVALAAWAPYDSAVGKNLRDIYPVEDIGPKEILTSRYGPKHCLEVVHSGRLMKSDWVIDNGTVIDYREWVTLQGAQSLDFVFYAASKAARALAKLQCVDLEDNDVRALRCLRTDFPNDSFVDKLESLLEAKAKWRGSSFQSVAQMLQRTDYYRKQTIDVLQTICRKLEAACV